MDFFYLNFTAHLTLSSRGRASPIHQGQPKEEKRREPWNLAKKAGFFSLLFAKIIFKSAKVEKNRNSVTEKTEINSKLNIIKRI